MKNNSHSSRTQSKENPSKSNSIKLPFDLLNETALLRSMLNQFGDELIVTASDGKLIYVNDAVENGLGLPRKILLQKNIIDFFAHKISLAQWQKEFLGKLKASRRPEKFIIERVGRYRKPHVIEITAVYLEYQSTELILLVGRDITDKISLQNKLVESELRYRQLSERASEGIMLIGFDGTIYVMNHAVENILGGDEQQIVNTSFYDYLIPDSKPKLRALINKIRTGSPENFGELEILTPSGDKFYVEILLTATTARYKERPEGLNCIIRDISRKKQMQMLIQESEKMKALQNFISGTAQEIQYPIHGLLDKITDVIDRYKDRDFEYIGFREFKDLMHTLSMMREQAKNCCDTADRLLSINKRKAGLQKSCADVNSIINDTVKKFENELKLNDVRITYFMDSSLPPVAVGEIEFGQVVYHVFLNAMQAMIKGGKITIRTSLLKKEQRVQIEIKDSGAGIPQEVLPHVFEPFFTTKQTGYEKSAGLGLSIVHSIVRHFNGEIFIKSDIRRGTSVIVNFPICKNNHKK